MSEDGDEPAVRMALARYPGDLAKGEVVGSWLLEERDRLRALEVAPSMVLGAQVERDDPAAAAEIYQGIVLREDLNEEAHRWLRAAPGPLGKL